MKSDAFVENNCLFVSLPLTGPLLCLTTDVSLTADPRVVSSISAWSHTYVKLQTKQWKNSLPLTTGLSDVMLGLANIVNNMDPDQTAPKEAVWSGFILFAAMIQTVYSAFEYMQHT